MYIDDASTVSNLYVLRNQAKTPPAMGIAKNPSRAFGFSVNGYVPFVIDKIYTDNDVQNANSTNNTAFAAQLQSWIDICSEYDAHVVTM